MSKKPKIDLKAKPFFEDEAGAVHKDRGDAARTNMKIIVQAGFTSHVTMETIVQAGFTSHATPEQIIEVILDDWTNFMEMGKIAHACRNSAKAYVPEKADNGPPEYS